jgi:hypothetical protein
MLNIDSVIARMKSSGCISCTLEKATYDKNGQEVIIEGSFCTPAPEYSMIQITAYSIATQDIVWEKECETGNTCSIPFESDEEFECH